MKVQAITLRSGHVLEREHNKLWVVLKSEIMQPGKGASVIQVEMRDVRTGTKDNVRYRTQETVERVRLDQAECQYLYPEEDKFIFMNNETFDQLGVPADILGDKAGFLQEGMVVTVETYEGEALGVELPATVVMQIIEAEPVVKGQTASSSYKPAIVETGARVMVPPHVESGTKIVIRTEDGTYVERFKG